MPHKAIATDPSCTTRESRKSWLTARPNAYQPAPMTGSFVCTAEVCGRRCLAVEAVAHPAHRGDRVGAELPAQVAHVHVHDVGPGVEVHAPHVVEQLLAREHLA